MRRFLLVVATSVVLAAIAASTAPGCGGESPAGDPADGGASIGAGAASSSSTVTTTSASTASTSSTAQGGSGGASADGWVPIAGLESCSGSWLDLSKNPWPTRSWVDCGAGCREAPAAHVSGTVAAGRLSSGADNLSGSLYVSSFIEGPQLNYHELLRLDDDAPVFVVRVVHACQAGAGKDTSPLLLELIDINQPSKGNDTLTSWIGRIDPANRTLTPDPSTVDLSIYATSWVSGSWGWGVIYGGNVVLRREATGSQLEPVYQSTFDQTRPRARGDLVAWIDWGPVPTKIQSFTPAAGQRVLVDSPADAVGLALGEDRMVWAGAHGPQTDFGIYDAAEIYWSPETSDPASVVIHQGPSLTGKIQGGVDMATAGDFVALTTGGNESTHFPPGTIVWQISTNATWFIPARAGRFVVLSGISSKELLVKEVDPKWSLAYFKTYLRYDLSQLDALSTGPIN